MKYSSIPPEILPDHFWYMYLKIETPDKIWWQSDSIAGRKSKLNFHLQQIQGPPIKQKVKKKQIWC